MSRYTNQDSLIDAIKMAFEDEEDGYQIMHGSYWNANMVVSFIRDFPAEDVVPVVRCRDCIYGKPFNKVWVSPKLDALWCEVMEQTTKDDWFCADGERKA